MEMENKVNVLERLSHSPRNDHERRQARWRPGNRPDPKRSRRARDITRARTTPTICRNPQRLALIET